MESSEKKNKFSLVKFISISASLVVVVAVAFFFLLSGKESLSSNNNENTIEVSRMSLSVGNEVDVDLGELSELDIEEISYSSKDENVAKINEMGKVTAVNSGETDIVVVYKVDNVTYEKNVSVTVSSKSSDDFSMSDEISLKYSFSDGVKENVWTNKDVKINVSSNVNVKYAIDCSGNCKYYDLTDDKSILVTSEGEHVVTIMAYDKYGDSSVKKVNVKIDKTKPTCNFGKGPTPNEIYVGETATYVVECVDENSRLKVVNDIDFLDIKFPGKFKFTKDSIVSVVKDIYKKTKKTAIQVENIDDGYRYIITVNGIKAGKTKLELPKSVFVDYAGNVQEKITSKEIKVVDKKSDSQNKTYLNCKISYSNGVLTGSGSGSNTLVYYGFSNSYSGSNATTKRITKAGTYNYYVKDNAGNRKSCSIVVDKKDLVPTCNLSFDEETNRLTGTYADNSGGGMSYYGFSSTYGGSKTTWQYIKKSGTYYFYVKDKNGNTGSCEITVEIKPGKPTCSLSYSNGMLIASSYDINNVGFSYRGFSSSYSGVSEYTKVIGKPGTYNYYVKDKAGNTGSCSIDVKEIIEIKDPVCSPGAFIENHTCKTCPIGYYCDGVKKEQCPVNHTSSAGSSKIESCYTNIKPGNYKQDPHMSYYPSVAECPAGKYSAGGKVYYGSTLSCTNCPVGTYSGKGASSCTKCPEGYTNASEGSSKCELRTTCPAGQYLDKGVCKACPAGKYSAAGATSCTTCAAGTYSKGGAASCSSCAIGTYQDKTGESSCKNCPSGYTSSAGTTSQNQCYIKVSAGNYIAKARKSNQTECPAGTYSKAHTVFYEKTSKCESCPNGYTTAVTGSTSKDACSVRSSCGAGSYISNNICTTCPIGYYCDGVSKNKCPVNHTSNQGAGKIESCYANIKPGYYKQDPHSTTYPSVAECPAGKYSAGGNVYYGSTLSCKNCPAGTYSLKGASSCTKCPANSTNNKEGSSECNIKTSCAAGQYLENGKCKICPPDSYCSNNKKTRCPSGYFDGKEGSDDITDCSMYVAAGYFVSNPSASTKTVCPKGTYNGAHTVKYGQSSSCKKCKEGYTTQYQGAGSESQCSYPTTCPAGQYVDGKNCRDCPSGSYCVNGVKKQCPSPYSKSASKSDEIKDCYREVAAGSYVAVNGSTTTTKCAKGTYKEKHRVYSGQKSSCTPCGSNTTTSGEGAKSKSECNVSTWCPAGQYLDNTTCKACPAGKYSAAGSTSCKTCAAGTYSKGGAASCSSCAAGTYQDKTGQSSCKNCPSGYTSSAGTTSQNQCYITVHAGKYLKNAKDSSATNCPKGTYTISNTIVNYGNTSSCKTCAAGTTTSGEGMTSCNVQVTCNAGEYVSGTSCKKCPTGSYCNGKVSTKCPTGYDSNAGATKQTDCYVYVAAGQYLSYPTGSSKSSCPKGTYSAAHTVNYGNSDNCTKCPGGYTTSGTGSMYQSQCSVLTCVRDSSCGCETYNKGYYKNGTYTYNSTCSNNKANGTTIRNCKHYSSTSSGTSCRWVCDKYVYGNTTCKTYKCCEVNKDDDFEFNLIDFDFISDMVDQILSKLF